MQTVPSLVGTGTAIAAAASGLVFGQPIEPDTSTASRHYRPSRKISFDRDLPIGARLHSLPPSRAGPTSEKPPILTESLHDDTTSPPQQQAVSRHSLSHLKRPSTTKGLGRKLSLVKRRGSGSTIAESRDSTSSGGSWIRKFAIRPLSHPGGSNRSSLTFEQPPVTYYSHSPSAPILSHSQTLGWAVQRNKLVKRSKSARTGKAAPAPSHTRSKSHIANLGQPATSHQRSATLGHIRADVDRVPNPVFSPTISLGRRLGREHFVDHITGLQRRRSERTPGWTSFFHSRRSKTGGGGMASRLSEASPLSRSFSGKRISIVGDEGRRKAHLVKPRMVSTSSAPAVLAYTSELSRGIGQKPIQETGPETGPEDVLETGPQVPSSRGVELEEPEGETPPSRRSRRSFSMTLHSSSSPASWMSRSRNSLRRTKLEAGAGAGTGAEGESFGQGGHVSAPISGGAPSLVEQESSVTPVPSALHVRLEMSGPAQLASASANVGLSSSSGPSSSCPSSSSSPAAAPPAPSPPSLHASHQSHKRNLSLPLPSLPRNSTLHLDSPRVSSANGGPSAHPIRQVSGSSTSSAALSQLAASTRHDRLSLLSGSGSDARGFISGDDDDIDLKSDTMYDSMRTAASSRLRAVETPLDSIYDESPPGTTGKCKTKRLSIQELMLGRVWDGDDARIMEEDENDASSFGRPDDAEMAYTIHPTLAVPRLSPHPSHDTMVVTTSDFGRLCLDDDFDEDWGEEDAHFNPLSPPSKGSSLNSSRINPHVRIALADADGHETKTEAHHDTRVDRRLSTLFDWIEPADGKLMRPKTASGKQGSDARGGRTCSRKGPVPAHIRSQSVPVAPESSSGNAKPSSTLKYGTWGLGTKPVSEDWDEDFEFSCGENGDVGEVGSGSQFMVPESIRASQPSVKAHSGQIRELSLLVNDLKRLYRHGRDMDMLEGSHRTLWKEAEGVIALASPDEEDGVAEGVEEEQSVKMDTAERGGAVSFDAASLGRLEGAFDSLEPAMSRIAVVRERHSPKRRSVFCPEDDIFGGSWLSGEGSQAPTQVQAQAQPRTPIAARTSRGAPDAPGVTRSVMEAMYRSIPQHTPGAQEAQYDKKVHFDTNSLRVLVRRAGELRDSLSDLVRHAERITQTPSLTPSRTPIRTPRQERHADSSPAFTRVFDGPDLSPQRRLIRSRGNSSLLDGSSPQNVTSSPMGTRLRPMTVS